MIKEEFKMAKGFKGFGGMGNMGNIMAQAQKMQKDLENAQQEIKLLRLEGTAGGGLVKLTLGGDHRIYDLQIAKEVIDPEDSEGLADLIIAAFNQANEQLDAISAEKVNSATGGMKLPF